MNPSLGSSGSRLATIALGANIDSRFGSPLATLTTAICYLRSLGPLRAVSPIWHTPPVGYRDQPWFHNAVVQLHTSLPPQALLAELLRIEATFGRDRSTAQPNGPRALDLDLLLIDDLVLQPVPKMTWCFNQIPNDGFVPINPAAAPALTLPHPRLTERAFVLLPLAEIAPTLVHPLTQRTISEHLADLPAPERAACEILSAACSQPPRTKG